VIFKTVGGYAICGAEVGGKLPVVLARVKDDWVWGNDRIDNTPKVGFGWFDKLVFEKVKDRMGNIGGVGGGIAWCD
jgi:hypothetical protein